MTMHKVFRIEHFQGSAAAGAMAPFDAVAPAAAPPAHEITPVLDEIRALRQLVEGQQAQLRSEPPPTLDLDVAQRLKTELDAMHLAIEQTKREIANLHTNGFKGPQMSRVTGELDAIVDGTFAATDEILTAAESIERSAGMLQAHCKNSQDRQAAADISDQVVRIYESCNFQDLTGQRITKVVSTLTFIEERLLTMMGIWGGVATFEAMDVAAPSAPEGDASLLNGPRLTEDAGHVSQDDIDALFG